MRTKVLLAGLLLVTLSSVLYVGRRKVADSGRRTRSRSWRWAPACSGSAGMASTPAASSASTQLRLSLF